MSRRYSRNGDDMRNGDNKISDYNILYTCITLYRIRPFRRSFFNN